MQGSGRIGGQQPLEAAEGNAGEIELFRGLSYLQGDRVFHKGVHPPAIAVFHPDKGIARACGNQPEAFPLRIAALLLDLFPQVGSDVGNVVHQCGNIGENMGIDFLQDPPLSRGVGDPIGFVDMAAAVRLRCFRLLTQRKLARHFQCRIHKVCSLPGPGPV